MPSDEVSEQGKTSSEFVAVDLWSSLQNAKLLAEATNEEVEAGFLMKGMSASEVSKFFGHDSWGVVRRFVLVQDGGRKVRSIDDCLEAQLNAAFSATIALQLHDSDYIASLALFIAERLQGSKLSARARCWESVWTCQRLTSK